MAVKQEGKAVRAAEPVLKNLTFGVEFEAFTLDSKGYMASGSEKLIKRVKETNQNIAIHQMEGFSIEKATQYFNIPENYVTGSMIAIGYPVEDKNNLPEDLKKRDQSPRTRKPFEEMIWKV